MCHRVRAAQQEIQKKKYIDQMDETTAFLTVDWSQKILPQQFREGQTAYFGKKGMSLLVGSFVFKDPSHDKLISKTYMVALTKCSQRRKIPIEDYVLRIRTARFPDGSKRFNTSQYITKNQVKNQIKMLSKASTADSSKGKKRVHNDASTKENRLKKSRINSNTTLPLIEENTDDDTSDEEDTRAVESATQFEDLKQMIINSEF
ncbi:unnamed protein product [Rotaria sordida]|uniref:Uncharacterized protein n=1 Tax=Rotaria sordida TaxID=392033 RepID=A0A815VE27_9BILA|nr:unnamed protein product [Rotaria sordida]CAF4176610.1 unnamed protein product [Rotaria sordida]